MTLHKEGYSLVGGVVVVSAIAQALMNYYSAPVWAMWIVGVCCTIVLILFAQFFRLPSRTINSGDGNVMCPSDGKVVVIEKVNEPEYFMDDRIQVSIFMSPLNVHAQWTPLAGVVKFAVYHAGKYLVAWHPKSSLLNERTTLVIEGSRGEVLFRQIAGAVARRIRYYIAVGDKIEAGQSVGFIKFGSRIDIYLPLDAEIKVKLDEKVTGRETVLAILKP
jgi:phosphatidylserine decarboxylase